MHLTENAKTLLSMGCYMVLCHVAAALIMQIEYSGVMQSKTCGDSESLRTIVVTPYIKSFMEKNLSLKINTTDVNLMVKGLNKYLEKKCAKYHWKTEISWETYMRWHYFITVTVSTVGYGDVYPETTGGRIFVVLFALLGIPVFMYMVASIGNIFCDKFCKIRNWFQRNLLKRAELTCPDVVCVVQCIIVTCLYVIIGGIIAAHVRGWTKFEGIYWAFITYYTIGYGDLTPGFKDTGAWYGEVLAWGNIIGLSLVAMTFNVGLKVFENRKSKTKRKTCKTCEIQPEMSQTKSETNL